MHSVPQKTFLKFSEPEQLRIAQPLCKGDRAVSATRLPHSGKEKVNTGKELRAKVDPYFGRT
jgi:hypothetical protein